MKKYNKYYLLSLLLAMAASLVSVSCADEDIVNDSNKGSKNGMSFAVTDVQDAPDADMAVPAASKEAFAVSNIDFNEGGTADMCLQESTVPGVNPMKRTPQTRAWLKSTIDGDFGVSACANGSADPDFFYNEKVNQHGQMSQPVSWSGAASTLKFYAVYPYMDGTNANQKLVQATAGSLPYVQFEASTDIANQTDLMVAETNSINFIATGGLAHVIPLKFTHALTAVRFGIGSNLSWNKTIKSIEFQGIHNAGQYSLATKTWSNQTGSENFKLDNLNQPTAGTQNTVIVKDGKTFLMVPQTLPTGAKMVITFTNGSRITANIGGKKWLAGTTKTYMITEKNSNWEYRIETTSPAEIAYDQTQSTTPYTVKSYRKDPTTNTFQEVKWKVVAYQESTNNGSTWTAESMNKPTWLTNLTLTEGDGGTAAESGMATVSTDIKDELAAYNKVLQDASLLGSPSNLYDLSLHNFKGQPTMRNTANSYLISAPGYYKIPLVYGNAFKDGNPNPHAYISQAPTGTANEQYILRNFIDHAGEDINSPWITVTNGGANKPNGAKIVWADQSGIVDQSSLRITSDGHFVQFYIPRNNIKNGNAVIAVTRNGVVVWSWHLWFDHNDVLETVECTNATGFKSNVTKRTLGFGYRKWLQTRYDKVRVVRIKVEQVISNNGSKKIGYIYIKQAPGSLKEPFNTLYQFGRKDAFPGVESVSDGSIIAKGGPYISVQECIKHPETFYNNRVLKEKVKILNAWSMDNTVLGHNDNPVVKTIYDPCPVGFKVAGSRAFTAFLFNEYYQRDVRYFNIKGGWDQGWYFNNRLYSPDATVYMPSLSVRGTTDGKLIYQAYRAYWTNGLLDETGQIGWSGTVTTITENVVAPTGWANAITWGLPVRAVSE